ncbi:hypothetical protein [Tenacibaculum agarivorans]|uniref:hypothetical protein n=1 Tax=Tenacibaculum agarivorans TaxID=1908389 RepID=UPI00094B7A47|nr:hypothetical protein [Tenacibaculum agarivorans]
MYKLVENTKLYKKYIIQEKLSDIFICFYIIFIARWYLLRYRNQLIRLSKIENPKMEYYFMPGGVIWEDEYEDRLLHKLSYILGFAIVYRTKLLKYPNYESRTKHLNDKYKRTFYLAKKYFPDWIGFQKSRCNYTPELSNRLYRIEKVVSWRLKKFEQELDEYDRIHDSN